MTTSFDADQYLGRPRILFVGLANSSHTHSWIELLANEPINVRLFSSSDYLPPDEWKVKTYVTAYNSGQLDPDLRVRLFDKGKGARFVDRMAAKVGRRPQEIAELKLKWLSEVVQRWQPDIIHTLGLDAANFYFAARRKFGLEQISKWLLQTRGGSDLALAHVNPQLRENIGEVLRACDQFLSDNLENFRIARELGVADSQLAEIAPIPGTGGIDVDSLASDGQALPSSRRMILWPKAYECPWSKALPVLEALKMCWQEIQPAEVEMLALDNETHSWFLTLPPEIRQRCRTTERVPRNRALQLMRKARVMLAPSLVDGVPNSMYEAMAAGALPIVSPLVTLRPLVTEGRNVLFARNLYPEEIATALSRAMTDDALIDAVAENNRELVGRLADRNDIRARVIRFYEDLAGA
jgi:glycosyltransferase involved in cell wall biosynthesis